MELYQPQRTRRTRKRRRRVRPLSDRIIVKKKSQSKSVMDAGGGTGSNPLSLPPSLSPRGQKKSKFGDRTQKHYLPYEERKGQFILLSLKRKREKKHKKYEHIEHGRGM